MPRISKQLCLLFVITAVIAYHHEGDYWVKLDRSTAVYHNPVYFSNFSYKISFYNRTLKLLNCEFNLLRDWSDMQTKVQVYKWMSNEYRFFPVSIHYGLCDEYKKNTYGIRSILETYSNVKSCPLTKGYYYMRNAHMDFSTWPPFIPGGGYKVEEKYYDKVDLLYEINSFYTITEFIKRWQD